MICFGILALFPCQNSDLNTSFVKGQTSCHIGATLGLILRKSAFLFFVSGTTWQGSLALETLTKVLRHAGLTYHVVFVRRLEIAAPRSRRGKMI